MNPLAWLEADMARHMLVEFPLLMAAGAAFRQPQALAAFDRYGLTGWTLASLVAAFWMIPAGMLAGTFTDSDAAPFPSVIPIGTKMKGCARPIVKLMNVPAEMVVDPAV